MIDYQSMDDRLPEATPETDVAKRPWAPPTVEEIDYSETEAGFSPGAADAGFYS